MNPGPRFRTRAGVFTSVLGARVSARVEGLA
jgi:hypothetical protein